MSGGSLTVTGPTQIDARFEIGNASTLTANGPTARFIANGETKIIGGSFIAQSGGQISLPNATSYTNTTNAPVFRATGTNSLLDLRNLVSLTALNAAFSCIDIEAFSSGVVDLRSLTQIIDPTVGDTRNRSVRITADGPTSLVNLSSLVELQDRNNDTYDGNWPGYSSITIRAGGIVEVAGSAHLQNTVIQVIGGGSVVGTVTVESQSILQGHDGSINGDVLNRASVRPGTSAGALTITGNFTQTVAGTLAIELGGAGAGIGYDQLRVSGAATLDGTLALSLINGFNPAVGSTFIVMQYGSVVGEFALITGQSLSGGKVLVPAFNATNLTLTVAAALKASAAESPEWRVGSDELTTQELADFVAASQSRLDPRSRFGLVNEVEFVVTDLPNNLLGLAAGHIIWIDQDAAGFGWFVDSTPDADEEFEPRGAATGRMDLLTVLAHELGHLLGFEHDSAPGHLMSETLTPGTRLLPIGIDDDIDNVFAKPDWP